MTPGDQLRHARALARCDEAGKLLRRSMHYAAGGSVMAICAGALVAWRNDLNGAWIFLVCAWVLNYQSARTSRRARRML